MQRLALAPAEVIGENRTMLTLLHAAARRLVSVGKETHETPANSPTGRWTAWIGSVLLAAFAISLSPQAMAQSLGCGISAGPPNYSYGSGKSGEEVTLNALVFDNVAGCNGSNTTINVSIDSDSTGGAKLIDPNSGQVSSYSFTASVGSHPVKVLMGDNDTGSVSVNIGCPDCTVPTNLTFTYELNNEFDLEVVTPSDGVAGARPNDPVQMVFKATRNGEGYGVQIDFTLDSSPIGSVTSNGSTGLATLNFTAPASPGSKEVHAFYCVPGTGCDVNASATADLEVGDRSLSGTAGTLQYPYIYDKMSPVEVQLVDAAGDPVSGVSIHWSLSGPAATGSTLSATDVVTDANGKAATTITTGANPGSLTLKAEVLADANVTPATFTFGVTSISEPSLTVVGSPYFSGDPGQTVSGLTVHATNNSGGDAVQAPINWSIQSGDGTVPASTTTNASGTSSNSVTLGSVRGSVVVHASFLGAIATFYVDYNDIWELTALSPTSVEVPVGEQTELQVRYLYNEAPSSDLVLWEHTGTGSLSDASSLPDSSGKASTFFSASAPGVYQVTARADCGSNVDSFVLRSDGPSRPQEVAPACPVDPITFTITVIERTLAGGGSFQGDPGSAFELTVRADDDGSPKAGVAINWQVSGNGSLASASSTTAGNGEATNTLTLGDTVGTGTVTASRSDEPSASVSFSYTVVAPTLSKIDGDGQTGETGASAPLPLIVELRSGISPNAPVSGDAISWVVLSGPAQLAASSSTTDAQGRASMAVDFGNTPGTSQIKATDSRGLASVTFMLTTTSLPTLHIDSGNHQSGLPGTSADLPLVVRMLDHAGQPSPGETVSWSVVSGSATLASATTTTDSNGLAAQQLTFGLELGPVTVRASARGNQSVDFQLEVKGGTLAPASGNGQSGAVGQPLADPLMIRVALPTTPAAWRGGKPEGLAGVPVHWVVTAGGGSVSASHTLTDANGESSVIFTLGPDPGTHTVTATTPGGSTVFTATAFIPTGVMVKVSGDGQSLPTNTPSEPLVVELRRENGQPIPDIEIVWTAENASLDHERTVTDANGRAQVIASVLEPGSASVSASSTNPNAGPVTFSLNGAVANLPQLTPIQQQVAEAIDLFCPTLAAIANPTPEQRDLLQRCREIVDATGIDPDATILALDQWFAEMAQAQSDASLTALQSQLQNLKARLAALRGGMTGNGFAGLTLVGPGGSVPLVGLFKAMAGEAGNDLDAGFSRWGWFVTGSIGRGEFDPTSTAPAYDYDIDGLTSGIDYRLNDRLIIGGSLGYTRQDTDARDGSGSLQTKGWSLSAYGSWYNEHDWYVDGVLTWGRNRYRSLRAIEYTLPLPGGGSVTIDQLARASSSGDLLQSAFTLGRDFQKGAWNLGTYGRLMYSRVEFDESAETLLPGPGSGLGLTLKSRDSVSLATVLGGKASYARSTSWGVLMPYLEVEWERETKDDPNVIEAYFTHDPLKTPIIIGGNPMDRSFFRLGFGLSMLFTSGRSGFVYYERLAGRSGQSQENLSLGFRMEF